MVEAKASKNRQIFPEKPIRIRWTGAIPEFNAEKEFGKGDDLIAIELSEGMKNNFTLSGLEEDVPPGDIYRFDFDMVDKLKDFLHPLLKKSQRTVFTTPLAHIQNIILDQYYEPDGKCGIKKRGRSLFLARNCYEIILPVWSFQVGDKFYLDTVTKDLQDNPMTSSQKAYVEDKLIDHHDTFFFFSGLRNS